MVGKATRAGGPDVGGYRHPRRNGLRWERRARPRCRRRNRGRRDRGDRAEAAGQARARRLGLRCRARLHRHPHPLRRAGVLGSGAPAVVLSRRHDRGGGKLRLHDRAHPARASRRDRAHARERRGHGPCHADRGHRLGVRDIPRVPGIGPPARDDAQLHGVHRSYRAAALRDGRRGLRARGHDRGNRPHVPTRGRGARSGCGRILDQLLLRAPRHRRQAGSEPLRRARRGRGTVLGGWEGGQGRGARHAG